MVKVVITAYHDKLGQELAVGDCVTFPDGNSLCIGRVIKFNPKMIKIAKVTAKWKAEYNKYPQDVIKIDSEMVTLYLLKNIS